jgi:hypothetical protein
MAYVSKEDKAKLSPVIKAICKKYKVKATIAVHHYSTLVLNISASPLDFLGNYNEVAESKPNVNAVCKRDPVVDHLNVNVYWCHEQFTGAAKDFLVEVLEAMKGPDWFDKSDIQTDYFHVKHYNDINIGKWDKPYKIID